MCTFLQMALFNDGSLAGGWRVTNPAREIKQDGRDKISVRV